MRKLFSIALLLILGLEPAFAGAPAGALTDGIFSAITSAIASNAAGTSLESHLPACCRRNGKHHCDMQSPAGTSAATPALSTPDSCPFMPRTLGTVAPTAAALTGAAGQIATPSSPRVTISSTTHPLLNGDLRARATRGPPGASLL